jgi:citryl-CoA lyase
MSKSTTDQAAYRTSVSEMEGDFATLYGYPVDELSGSVTFTDAIYLAATGGLPSDAQREMLDRILVLGAAHGVAPSGAIARSLIACGSPIQVAMAGGALSVGDVHAGAGEQIAELFQERGLALARELGVAEAARRLVADVAGTGGRVPGFGHQLHHDGDPRAQIVLAAAKRLGLASVACELLMAMEGALAELKGRLIPANVDGVIAAVLTDLSIDWRFSRPIMIVGRAMALAALSVEEMKNPNRRWRELMVPEEVYTGPARRPVSQR